MEIGKQINMVAKQKIKGINFIRRIAFHRIDHTMAGMLNEVTINFYSFFLTVFSCPILVN